MPYKLSSKSLGKLDGVDPRLVKVIKRAIELTKVDFAVIEGLRTVERQRELVRTGASQTMDSNHIKGTAADLAAFVGNRISWELPLYDDIAEAMRLAARELGVGVRWGGAWHVDDIRDWDSSMQDAMNGYVDMRRKQGKRAFIDGPHFELAK